MRINSVQSIMQAYETKASAPRTTQRASQTDEVILSSFARDTQYALEQVKKAPDMRMDKVQAIKERIQNGTYNIDAKSVSEKMLSDLGL